MKVLRDSSLHPVLLPGVQPVPIRDRDDGRFKPEEQPRDRLRDIVSRDPGDPALKVLARQFVLRPRRHTRMLSGGQAAFDRVPNVVPQPPERPCSSTRPPALIWLTRANQMTPPPLIIRRGGFDPRPAHVSRRSDVWAL